jgi:WD40 repeat protein/serine/threonine protein kinase
MLEVKLLGQFQIRIDGKPVDIPSRAEQSLLAYLVLNTGTAFRREHLAGLFWPDSDEGNAKGYLRQALWRLRKSFTDTASSIPDYFQANKISIAFDPGYPYWLDTAVLEDETADSLEDILGSTQVYSGELLPGFYDEWAILEREQLRAIFNRKMHRLLEQLQSASRWQDLIQHAERWISMGDNPEPAYRALILGYAMLGDLSSAQAAYNRCRMVFERDLRVELSPETVLLAEKILSGEPLEQAAPIRGYQLRESIGEGEFGIVYRAQQPSVGREVAVKVIQPRYANLPDFIRHFEAEARLIARLEHPHIVPLYDFWREPDGAFLVMRWMRGGDLRSLLKAGPVDLEHTIGWVDQLADGLANAHQKGIVHGDLKPENLLFDKDENIYLSDFGIARQAGDPTSGLADNVSPIYSSPEHMLNEPLTAQSDLYCLGVLLYEMLAGNPPFKENSPAGKERQLPPLRLLREDLPPLLDEYLQRATAWNPDERFSDALSMAAALHDVLAGRTKYKPAIPQVGQISNPYKGLRAFEEADARDFFGRAGFVKLLIDQLNERADNNGANQEVLGQGRFLALVGPSGSGKSSLVKAGLLPALRQGRSPRSEKWFIVEMAPGSHPMEELEAALLRVAINPPASLLEQLREGERGILRAVKRILPRDQQVELLLVIDQFEEIFTLVEDPAQRQHFLEGLLTAVNTPDSRLRVVLTLRADFYDRPLLYTGFGELLRQHTEVVLPLSSDELAEAIRNPAGRVGVAFEEGLVSTVVADVNQQPGTLPLLQYALTELFERRQDGLLTLAAYKATGGVLGALSRRAEELYDRLSPTGQEVAQQVFLRLVTLGEGVKDTRRRVLRSELEAVAPGWENLGEDLPEKGAFAHILEIFGRYRLLSFDRDPLTRTPTVEIAHEALLHEWERMRDWIELSRADIRMQRVLARSAEDWEQSSRETSYLLHGSRLDQYAAWIESTDLVLTFHERTFLEASLAEQETRRVAEIARQVREAALEKRVRRLLRALVVVLLLATLGSLGLAWAARRQAKLATSRELAVMAINDLEVDPERSILFSLQALRTAYSRQAVDALHRAVPASRVRMALSGDADETLSVQYSPDGTSIAAASNNEVFVYDSGDGQKMFSLPGRVATYSPDGSLLAAGAQDGTVRILDLETEEIIHTLRGHSDWIDYLQFNPDGRMLVSQSLDDTFIVWDTDTGEKLFTSSGMTSGFELLYSVAFSPDGRLLLSQDVYSTEAVEWKVWGVDQDWALLNQFSSTSMFVFSPDGRWLASLGGRGVSDIILWDLSKLSAADRAILDLSAVEPLRAPAAHDNVITGLDFSTDGTLLATASLDGAAKIWQISPDGLSLLMTLSGHKSEVTDVAFSPDGTRLATSSYDGSVRIWDITPNGASEWFTLAAHIDAIHRFSLSEDGNYLATASQDMAKIWDLASGRELVAIHDPGGPLLGVDISPDGSRLATGGTDNVAKIWQLNLTPGATSAELVRTLAGHATGPPVGGIFNGLTTVVFSPDGTKLATGGVDKFAKVWDVETGQELLSVLVDTDGSGVTQLAFSPDGRYLVTASDSIPSGSVLAIIWDIASGKEVFTFTGHNPTGRIWGMAFSPDGQRVATGGEEGVLKIWDASTGEELLNLNGHTSSVNGVSFSPDGKYLVSSSPDGSVRVWDAASGEELQEYTSPGGAFDNSRFTPDGKNVIVSARGGFVYGYFFDTQDLISLAKSRLTRGFTPDECRQYLHSDTCPVEP